MLLYDLRSLIAPKSPLLIGEITAQNADDTMTVEFPDGSTITARGPLLDIGTKVYVQDRLIQGEAPDLPIDYVEG